MQKPCIRCKKPFEVTNDDLKFLDAASPVFKGKKELITKYPALEA
jgi:hypothetical protein